MMDLEGIKKILPHRYPFLWIDRVLEVRPGEYCKAIKNVTGGEEVFQGHFPGYPVFPGVLILEALAQTSGIVMDSTVEESSGVMVLYAGINNAKFRKPVVPGDQLVLESTALNQKRDLWVFEGKATVDGTLAAKAEVRLMLQRP
ncbi:MAG: 3-hydroxyacyl-ACP dehydratase FabZ [bacterium]|jgi:3-hydroxyacyl-[acyl-carrier-protein] dehydratase